MQCIRVNYTSESGTSALNQTDDEEEEESMNYSATLE